MNNDTSEKIFLGFLQLVFSGIVSLLLAGMIVDGVRTSPLVGLFVLASTLIIIHIMEDL